MKLETDRTRRAIIGASGLSIVAGLLYVLACWVGAQDTGMFVLFRHIGRMVIGMGLLSVLFVGCMAIGNLLRRILGSDGAEKRCLKHDAAFFVVCAMVLAVAFQIGESAQRAALRRFVGRVDPILDAIEAFQRIHGRAPQKLSELVPEFIAEESMKNCLAGVELKFVRNDSFDKFSGNPWALLVVVWKDESSVELLAYYPGKNYPTNTRGFYTTRIGDWLWIEGNWNSIRHKGLHVP